MTTSKQLNYEYQQWAKRYGISIDISVKLEKDYRNELTDNIYYTLFDADNDDKAVKGLTASSETSSMELCGNPESELPILIQEALDLLGADEAWKMVGIKTKDEWLTAELTLKSSAGEVYQYNIDDVDNGDYMSVSFFDELEKFSKQKCEVTLIYMTIDVFFRFVALPHSAATELENIIQSYSLPYIDD